MFLIELILIFSKEKIARAKRYKMTLLNKVIGRFQGGNNEPIKVCIHTLFSRQLDCHQHDGIYILTEATLCFFFKQLQKIYHVM